MAAPTKVLFVCMGNICRSPMAEAVFRRLARQAGLAERIVADSAGTHGYHVGEPPDPRAQKVVARHGYDLGGLCARQVRRGDFTEFDYVLAMDRSNLRALARLCSPEHAHKPRLFLEFADGPAAREVLDSYYGDEEFEQVLGLLEEGARALLRRQADSGRV